MAARQTHKEPTRKLVVGAVAGVGSGSTVGQGIAKIVIYYLNLWSGQEMPEDVAFAFELIFEVIVGVGLGLAAGYVTPPAERDTVTTAREPVVTPPGEEV